MNNLQTAMDVTMPHGWSFVYLMSQKNDRSYFPVGDASHCPESLQPQKPGGKTQTEMQKMHQLSKLGHLGEKVCSVLARG